MSDGVVITIGNFDGLHRGHQALMRAARQEADRRGAQLKVLTFDRHPAAVLRPEAAPPPIMRLADRLDGLRKLGADEIGVLEPTAEVLGQSPEAFLERLAADHPIRAMVEGPDFRFGKDRAGDVALLREHGRRLGFECVVVEPVDVALTNHHLASVRSSLVRWLIGLGRMADVAICLGRPYALTATIIRGEQRGRTLGVPTANLDVPGLGGILLPGDGVYAGTAILPGGKKRPAAVSIGVKPTFGQQQLVVEAHLLDFTGDLYGQSVTLHLSRWLREQQRFPGFEALRAQLTRDIAATRDLARCGVLTAV